MNHAAGGDRIGMRIGWGTGGASRVRWSTDAITTLASWPLIFHTRRTGSPDRNSDVWARNQKYEQMNKSKKQQTKLAGFWHFSLVVSFFFSANVLHVNILLVITIHRQMENLTGDCLKSLGRGKSWNFWTETCRRLA